MGYAKSQKLTLPRTKQELLGCAIEVPYTCMGAGKGRRYLASMHVSEWRGGLEVPGVPGARAHDEGRGTTAALSIVCGWSAECEGAEVSGRGT